MLGFVFCGAISFLIWQYNRPYNRQKKTISNAVISCLIALGFAIILYGFFSVESKNAKYLIDSFFGLGLIVNVILFTSQAIKLFRTKNSNNLSIITFAGFNVKQMVIALHAYVNSDPVLMYGYVLAFASCGVVTFLIFFYRKKNCENTLCLV